MDPTPTFCAGLRSELPVSDPVASTASRAAMAAAAPPDADDGPGRPAWGDRAHPAQAPSAQGPWP